MKQSSAGTFTSGENISFWIDTVRPFDTTALDRTINTDILIIGGGIAGLTTAYCLLQSGRQVVVIEDGKIGSGETGRTTAHLTNALDDRYYQLNDLYGEEKTKLAAQSHTAAIDLVEKIIKDENIDCDFQRVTGYLFLHPSDEIATLQKELTATKNAGLQTEWLDKIPGIQSESGPCIAFPQQAQFHIMKYIKGLSEAIVKKGGRVYTGSKATKIKEDETECNGFKIRSSVTIVATNSPVNDIVTMHTKQFAYRTYVIAALIPKTGIHYGLWWDTGDQDSKWITHPYHYVRLAPFDEKNDLLISGGEDHKTGQADREDISEEKRYFALEEWTRKRFPAMQDILYSWSGQVLEPLDSLAFIGKNPGNKNIYIITGDSGNGMTHGSLAGILITDLVNKRANAWEELYKPSRIPLNVAGSYIREMANMAAQYGDYLSRSDIESVNDLEAGDGAIINMGLKKVALYRDDHNMLHAYSAVCTHLGCVVQWNGEEKSFDCPCHGSRFTKYGEVINGPAIKNLKEIEIRDVAEHEAH